MACRGVFFALTVEELSALNAAASDQARLEIVQEEIENKWDVANLQEVDKAWEAIHRILSQQSPEVEGISNDYGSFLLNQVIFGSKQLYSESDYLINLNEPDEVNAIADAIESLDEKWFREQFKRYCSGAYPYAGSEEDEDYSWGWFQSVRDFYVKQRGSGRPVIFTVDF